MAKQGMDGEGANPDKNASIDKEAVDQNLDKADKADNNFDVTSWLKAETPSEIVRRVTQIENLVTYSGPLPPSSELENYDRVLPGAADRIIRMAENAQSTQHYAIKEGIKLNGRRITTSTIVSLSLVATAGLALLLDPAWLSIPLGTGGILTLILRDLYRVTKKQ